VIKFLIKIYKNCVKENHIKHHWKGTPFTMFYMIHHSLVSTINNFYIWTQFEPVHQCFVLINHLHVSYSYWWTRSPMFMWFTMILPHQFLLVNTSFCNSSPMFFCNSQFCCHSNSHWWTLYFEPVYLCLMFSMIHHSLCILYFFEYIKPIVIKHKLYVLCL
jgi:hypothetical protein